MKLVERPRRLRRSASVRDLVQESHLSAADLIWPAFLIDGQGVREEISSLPGCSRFSPDLLLKEAESLAGRGLRAIALFPRIEDSLKDPRGREAINPKGLVPQTVGLLKERLPEITVITDVALDPYSSEGHDGIVEKGEILNDESVMILGEQALMQARAGADFVAPSDMMDGRVGWIRKILDENGFTQTGIISYSAKYASGFYGPFREALMSAPRFGDKKTYQLNPMNRREALREARLDQHEGCDVLLIKPALSYLDIILEVRRRSDVPIAAYNVSGEYAMVKAAAQRGWLDERTVTLEILGSIKRAGADMIFSYHTPDVLAWLNT
ncbi:MAG: porphobilinogen synthase [Bdellovibrionales bacterium]